MQRSPMHAKSLDGRAPVHILEGMEIAPEVTELEDLAGKLAVKLPEALRRAGVANSTYWRWRYAGKEPLTGTIRKVRAAINELAGAA